ncbi:MAG: VWA domain-containing protein [Acidobacteriota bacterium]
MQLLRLSLSRPLVIGALVLVALVLATASAGATEEPDRADLGLAERFVDWLEEVEPIITEAERRVFGQLTKDYQRDAFIRRFWKERDPYPQTGRNELRERFVERIAYARANYSTLEDARARILLVHGEPDREIAVRCTTTRQPAVIWLYSRSEQIRASFALVFLRAQGGTAPAILWRPGTGGAAGNVVRSSRACINGPVLEEVMTAIIAAGGAYDQTLDRVLARPRPKSLEWVVSFLSESTDLPRDAELFNGNVQLDYPGRHQSRTLLQAVVQVDADEADLGDFAGYRSYDFVLLGEVILRGQLFESFRYKYGFPADGLTDAGALPMTFQRYLRPGEYRLILRVQDLNGDRYLRRELDIVVPQLDNAVDIPPPTDEESARLFEEAQRAMASGEATIRILESQDEIQTGFVRFNTLASPEIERVSFLLDNREVLVKNTPPFNVELDLGTFPKIHTLRVEASDATGDIVAEDEIEINSGRQRFSVRLIEPGRNRNYRESLLARAEVLHPEGSTIERVELFLNERLAATLYQEPWEQPIRLDRPGETAYVRAVAYLADGNTTEDLVFVNSPDLLEEVDVQFVELYASVLDREGKPIQGLQKDDFVVREDGEKQNVVRFETVEDLPIHVGVVIDNSASMRGSLETTRITALKFFEQAITPKDRAAVITFNRFPNLAVGLTNDMMTLGSGLAGLTAEGQTALYDSVMFSLYYFAGITGQRALLVLSDGKDEVSRFTFEQTLEYAKRAGVTVYSVGLKVGDGTARNRLQRLSRETGGDSYFIKDIRELPRIYDQIQGELRSQYLLAYQSNSPRTDDGFRAVKLIVERPGAKVRTMSGYYP